MIRARLTNAFRRIVRHPAAHARREEARRMREARARIDAKHRQKALDVAAILNVQIARERADA